MKKIIEKIIEKIIPLLLGFLCWDNFFCLGCLAQTQWDREVVGRWTLLAAWRWSKRSVPSKGRRTVLNRLANDQPPKKGMAWPTMRGPGVKGVCGPLQRDLDLGSEASAGAGGAGSTSPLLLHMQGTCTFTKAQI